MIAHDDADLLLRTRGRTASLDAFVVAISFDHVGNVAFGLGDGTLCLGDEFTAVEAHDGGVLCLAAHPAGGFVSGGDDGRLVRTGVDGAAHEVASFGGRWVEQVASWRGGAGLIAAAAGKRVELLDGAGVAQRRYEHATTVTGLAFDGKGKRLAASHYNGASLRFVAAREDKPRLLEWKGSHTGVAIHPAADAVVTTMQDNALHGWRLADGQHMRMSGYPAKTASLGFTRNGRWLASSGAEVIVLWPFFGGGPMGKPPRELGGGSVMVTRIACHPEQEAVAAGHADGSVILAEIGEQKLLQVAGPGRGAVSALAWSPDGTRLAIGTETGFAAVIDFRSK